MPLEGNHSTDNLRSFCKYRLTTTQFLVNTDATTFTINSNTTESHIACNTQTTEVMGISKSFSMSHYYNDYFEVITRNIPYFSMALSYNCHHQKSTLQKAPPEEMYCRLNIFRNHRKIYCQLSNYSYRYQYIDSKNNQ